MGNHKKCFKCGRLLDRSMFYSHSEMADGLLGKCKECCKRDVSRNYHKNSVYYRDYDKRRGKDDARIFRKRIYSKMHRIRNPGKRLARAAVGNALASGRLKKMPCDKCGSMEVQAHHSDYSKPLEVTWLCHKHHQQMHGKMLANF